MGGSGDGRRAGVAGLDALVLTSLIWFLAKFLRYAFPPLFPAFRTEFAVSNTTLGTAFTAMMLCYAAMQFPSGALADRLGAVRVIAGGALVASGGALLVGLGAGTVAGLGGLVAAMLFIGVGTGAHKTVAVTLLPRVYARRGRALGALDTFGTFGGVAAPVVAVGLVGTGPGWEALFLGAGVGGVLLAGLFARRVPRRLPPDADRGDDGDREAGLRRYAVPFASPRFVVFVAVTVLFSFAYNGVVAFLPSYLVAEAGMSEAAAGLTFSGLFVVSLVQPLTGEAADRAGELPVIAATLAAAAAGLGLLLLAAGPLLAAGAALLLGAGSHGFRPVRSAHLVTLIPTTAAGGTLGVVRTALMGAGAVAPAVVGYLSDVVGFRAAFLVPAGSLVAAAVLAGGLLLTRDRRPSGAGAARGDD